MSTFKVMAGSRVKERTESIASQDASPAKHPARHRKWTEAWACAQRAAVFLVTKDQCASNSTVGTRSLSCSLLYPLQNIWGLCVLSKYLLSE